MKISRDEVFAIANLARLELREDEVDQLSRQLSDILVYIEKLNSIDTTGVPPTTHALQRKQPCRDDETVDFTAVQSALANAPAEKDGFFVVPQVI